MLKSGMTRRIDDLGRIVIPKEIRKNFKIRNNDELEIGIIDDGIILKKSELSTNDDVLNKLLVTINKTLKKNILLTSKDKIIDYHLEKDEDIENLELSNNVIKIIENRLYKQSNLSNIMLTNKEMYLSYIISPININGDIFGSLILYTHDDNINQIDTNIVKFATNFLEKYLE